MNNSGKYQRIFILGLCITMTLSCVSRKRIAYFQEDLRNEVHQQQNNLEIKPDDLLTIRVSSPEQEAALPFNLTKTIGSQDRVMGQVELETYMVSDKGTIEFPVVGTLEVKGLTSIELAEKIKSEIADYLTDAIVNVRILNFQISVLGEVNQAGTFIIEDDHISLPKALGLAGDLTIHGKRNNIMVLREVEGVKSRAYLDITDANIVNSPYYNLVQNDIIYVEPRGAKRQSSSALSTASSYISIASVLISMAVLITNQ